MKNFTKEMITVQGGRMDGYWVHVLINYFFSYAIYFPIVRIINSLRFLQITIQLLCNMTQETNKCQLSELIVTDSLFPW